MNTKLDAKKSLESLTKAAINLPIIPIHCGNTWQTLESKAQDKRSCNDCGCSVYNLAQLNTTVSNELRNKPSEQRKCVVFEPLKLIGLDNKLRLLKTAASLLVTVLLCEWAIADSALDEADEYLQDCSNSYYSPMYISPETKCLDEDLKKTTVLEWQKIHPSPYIHNTDPDFKLPPSQ